MAPDTKDDNKTELNPGKSITDKKFNDLARRTETEDLENSFNTPSADPSQEDENIKKLRDSETNPNKPLGISDGDASRTTRSDEESPNFYRPVSKYGGTKSSRFRGLSKNNANAILKRGGPIGLIVALLGVGGFGIASLFALMPIHIMENLVSTFNSQNTSMTIRTNKLLAKKMSGDITSGSCSVVKVACRFQRPSNKFLNRLAKQGITAEAADGSTISGEDGKWVNKIPKNYVYMKDGVETKVAAKDFYSTLVKDADFRAGFHAAYNPLYQAFSDAKFKIIERLDGFSKQNKLKDVKSDDDANKVITEDSAGEKVGAGEDTAAAAKGEVQDLAEKEAKILEKVGKGGGGAVGLAAGGVCILADMPQLVASAESAYEKVQIIKFGMSFLTPISAWKAGDTTVAQTTALGNAFTKQDKNGKSMLDSFGLKLATGQATVAAKNDPAFKFSPGADIYNSSFMQAVLPTTDSTVRKDACKVATNPATGAAIDIGAAAAAPETLGATILGQAINLGAGWVASELVEHWVMPLVGPLIEQVSNNIMSFFVGDLTKNLVGEDAGNALASGAANMMSETASAGGNVPLTPNEAVAYNEQTQSVNLAYAQEDQTTLSPFDATSQYTALGSFINNLIPYFSDFSSLTGVFSTLKNIAFSPMTVISNLTHTNAASASQYQSCADPNLDGVAAGPFCNVIYGIPDQYLNMDPEDVVTDMVKGGYIDEDTGDPIKDSDYADWMDLCLEGGSDGSTDNSDTSQTKNCMMDTNTTDATTKAANDKNAMFAVYTIDHRIQVGMDGDTGDDSDD